MAREATARLYDVDQNSVVLKNLTRSGKYDHGTITFQAKPGKFVDLDKLHESVWATRLSVSTRSGLISLQVTVAGEVEVSDQATVIRTGSPVTSDRYFELAPSKEADHRRVLDAMREAVERGERVVTVTGKLEGWSGVWPQMLKQLPPKPRRLLVTSFETASGN